MPLRTSVRATLLGMQKQRRFSCPSPCHLETLLMPVWDQRLPQSLSQVLSVWKVLRVIAHQKWFHKAGEMLCGLIWVAVLFLPETAG